jgi:hypothetical protein
VNEFRNYLFSYHHEGARWSFEIRARDLADAKARVAKLPFATLDGEIVATIPASMGWLARSSAAIRNAFARRAGG